MNSRLKKFATGVVSDKKESPRYLYIDEKKNSSARIKRSILTAKESYTCKFDKEDTSKNIDLKTLSKIKSTDTFFAISSNVKCRRELKLSSIWDKITEDYTSAIKDAYHVTAKRTKKDSPNLAFQKANPDRFLLNFPARGVCRATAKLRELRRKENSVLAQIFTDKFIEAEEGSDFIYNRAKGVE